MSLLITPDEINSPKSFTIKQAGHYILTADVNWTISQADSFAISIETDNVTIDFQKHYIKQLDIQCKHCFAIQIGPLVKNVQIMNLCIINVSGGGIWLRGGNEAIVIKRIQTRNCGYHGLTLLDPRGLMIYDPNIPKIPNAYSQGLLLDGGYGRLIKNVQILECDFYECGIYSDSDTPKYEISCGAILIYQAENILIQDCSVDGCVGLIVAFGISLIGISNVMINDVIISDIYSNRRAEGYFIYDIDAELKDVMPTAIYSNVNPNDFIKRLNDHGNSDYMYPPAGGYPPVETAPVETDSITLAPSFIKVQANHFKNVIYVIYVNMDRLMM